MSLKHLLFIVAYALASTNAAVNFYGSERPNGDYVTCEVPDVSDEDVSAALGFLYFPSEVIADSNDLQFNETMFCGDLASVAVEFTCFDLGGESNCIPTETEAGTNTDADTANTNSDTAEEDSDLAETDPDTAETDADAVSERSLAHLERRTAGVCDEWSLECKNQYQSTTGYCASDYTKETFAVQGTTGDIWCSKPCTDEEEKACTDQICPKGKQQCEKYGYSNDCVEALLKCVGSPVKMSEDVCTTKYMSNGFRTFCKNKDPPCVSYEDGACTLSSVQSDAFVKFLKSIFG